MNKKIDDTKVNFKKALRNLVLACETPIAEERDIAGIIKSFEFVYELSWKLLKRVLEDQGKSTTTPRDVLRNAFQFKLIEDESQWLQIIDDRNLTVHTYDSTLAKQMVERIKSQYLNVFRKLENL